MHGYKPRAVATTGKPTANGNEAIAVTAYEHIRAVIHARTDGGQTLVDVALNIVEGNVRANPSTKMRAVEYLTQYLTGLWVGRPTPGRE